jgi:Choline/Carnitine o-acyltransferase
MCARLVAQQMGRSHPMFEHPVTQESVTFHLSTSQVGYSKQSFWGGFAAATNEGFGCCYTIQPDSYTVSIASSHASKSDRCPKKFARELSSALKEIADLVSHCQASKAKL